MDTANQTVVATKYWHRLDDERIQCDLCPGLCKLQEGQRGLCFVRVCEGGEVVLTTYGRSSGFCIDPIEKKPLNHFLPGTAALSFGTAGCNLACKFCQNWDISKSREIDTLADAASPGAIARAARELGCRSVAFTYNDPVIFHEYAIDVAQACHEVGVKTVAVTAGYVCKEPRAAFYRYMDTGNVHDEAGSSTYCYQCGRKIIGRDWYVMTEWHLTDDGRGRDCRTACAGVFDGPPGTWGAKRLPVRLKDFAK